MSTLSRKMNKSFSRAKPLKSLICRLILLPPLFVLAACSGGGGNSGGGTNDAPPPAPLMSTAAAHRFLRQATFGPTTADVQHLQSTGYEAWIDEQLALPVSQQLPYMDSLPDPENSVEGQQNRMDAWFQNVLHGPDQLRQRVAFALSEIMVVSDQGVLFNSPNGLAYYYDQLSRGAFTNYRDLMGVVTLTPAMGVYLSMLGNEKPDPARNIRPDENYARELMQLFTIGLVRLNPDGTVQLDTDGQPIPTYDQTVIEGFAHVYTGWTFGGSAGFYQPSFIFRRPMVPFEDFHDTGEKLLLGGVALPAGQSARQDLQDALDNIFAHENVAPFVSRRLIQRLVSANPSPGYVGRVASVFEDDGSGTRGNLGAVVKAILLDPEAREITDADTGGKLTEPLLRLTALWRAFHARAANGRYLFANPQSFFGQAPLRSHSVFNFFSPDYAPAGEIKDLGLVSPEMQITNETTSSSVNNYLAVATFLQHSEVPNLQEAQIYIVIDEEMAIASDAEALVDDIAVKLLGGDISDNLRAETLAMVNKWELPSGRVVEAIHSIVTSPEFAVLP